MTNDVSNNVPFGFGRIRIAIYPQSLVNLTKRSSKISGAIFYSPSGLLLYKDHQEEQTGTVHEEQLQQCKGDDTRLALTNHEGNYQGNLGPSLLQKNKVFNGICFLLKAICHILKFVLLL